MTQQSYEAKVQIVSARQQWPILAYRQWPRIRFKQRRGVTAEEHRKLVAAEKQPERKAFLELLWHVGAAQIDLVSLTVEDVNWNARTISYRRRKNGSLAILRFGEEVAAILRRLHFQRRRRGIFVAHAAH